MTHCWRVVAPERQGRRGGGQRGGWSGGAGAALRWDAGEATVTQTGTSVGVSLSLWFQLSQKILQEKNKLSFDLCLIFPPHMLKTSVYFIYFGGGASGNSNLL